ncbi:MAG TPA: DUF6278 family protein [Polyangiaceae bacterium]|nr:DUF6278 family protein [Polyangiaceae bacterium]
MSDEETNGRPHVREDLPPPAELTPPPPSVAEALSACVRFVHAKYGVLLDGTSDTLSLLDQYVRDARAEIAAKPAALELLATSAGAYLGEVLRREYGAEWLAEGDPSGWRLLFTHVFLSFNPVGLAREALVSAEQEGWHAHLATDPAEQDGVMARLASLPEVDEEEYYLPSTRFDVVGIVFEHLRARMARTGTADVTFSADDY